MINSLKQTMIMLFSLFTMLMSNYVSSAPSMAFSTVSSMVENVAIQSDLNSHHDMAAHRNVNFAETALSAQSMSPSSHHSTGCLPTDSDSFTAEKERPHCGESESGVHTCCGSVCSSVSYPIQHTRSISVLVSSLAQLHPIKIGDTVTRSQSILRPPSI